jgi:phenylacetate-CoA ligase
MKFELSVVTSCFNEAKNIPELLERLQNVFVKKNIKGEIILVNDGSTDGTADLAAKISSRYPNLKVINHKVNSGIEGGWKTGLANSEGEFVCFIDSDLQYLPEDVWRMFREIRSTSADMVQGYRSSIGRLRDSRYIQSVVLNFILNNLFGMRLKDNKSGFVIARKEVLEDILRHRYHYKYFQTFVTISANAKGYAVREIETMFQSRLLGRSFIGKFSLKSIFWVLYDVVKGFFEFRVFNKKENVLQTFLLSNRPGRYQETLGGLRKYFFEFYMALMPLHHWLLSKNTESYYKELKESQWLSLERIKALQEIKLRKLVNHAYYHVAYYRELFDKINLKPSDINTIEDLAMLPLLNKQDVKQNLYFDLMSDNHRKKDVLRITTSGSTGEPFVCYVDRDQVEIRWAATLRSMEWTGYRFGDKQARLWHQTLGMTKSQIFKEKIDALLNRRLFIPAFAMSEANLKKFISKLCKYRPVLIDGYAESFNFLAYYIKQHGLEGISPKGIISSAQVLPQNSRKIIEDEFNTKVFDKYGSREFSGIAYECDAHAGHHIVAESYIVEILKDGKPALPGEIGEVVITDLNNFCMPFLRYRVGDLAQAMDNSVLCACGRGLPRIGQIEGRVQSIIFGMDKRILPSSFFGHFFKDYDFMIRQYQVIQETYGAIILKIIKSPRFNEEIFEKEIIFSLKKFLGRDIKIDVQFVEEIPLGRTGKHQACISKLDIDFQNLGEVMNFVNK